MLKVNFYELNTIEDNKLLFAVIMAKYNGHWIYVRHKERQTWEIPGVHREINENINDTASRELFEETGAKKFNLTSVCTYSVERDETVDYNESFGQLFYSEVETLDKLPDFEIKEIKLFDDIPDDLTYPFIQPFLHKKVLDFFHDDLDLNNEEINKHLIRTNKEVGITEEDAIRVIDMIRLGETSTGI